MLIASVSNFALGDPASTVQWLPLVYDELKRLAHRKMRNEPAGQTLQTTGLVHEAFLRLMKDENCIWENRAHFFSAAAIAMRRILVERARRRKGPTAGGKIIHTPVEPTLLDETPIPGIEILALDDAMREMEAIKPQHAKTIEYRYFAGLTIDQTAELMGVSPSTVSERCKYGLAWLEVEIDGRDAGNFK